MAFDNPLIHLKNGVEAWNSWREENPHIQPILTGEAFYKLNFSKINFEGVRLDDTRFEEVDLSGAILSNAIISRATVIKSNLSGVILTNVGISESTFLVSILDGINLTRAKVRKTSISNCSYLINSDLSNLTCVAMDFSRSVISRVNFSGANLNGAQFVDAILEETRFNRANLNSVSFRGARISNSSFNEADLTEAYLLEAEIDFNTTDFTGANLINSQIDTDLFTSKVSKGVSLPSTPTSDEIPTVVTLDYPHSSLSSESEKALEAASLDLLRVYGIDQHRIAEIPNTVTLDFPNSVMSSESENVLEAASLELLRVYGIEQDEVLQQVPDKVVFSYAGESVVYEDVKPIETSVSELVEAYGLLLVDKGNPRFGSFFNSFRLKFPDEGDENNSLQTLKKIFHDLKAAFNAMAGMTMAGTCSMAASKLARAIRACEPGTLQICNIVIVKHKDDNGEKIFCGIITPKLLAHLNDNPGLRGKSDEFYRLLIADIGKNEYIMPGFYVLHEPTEKRNDQRISISTPIKIHLLQVNENDRDAWIIDFCRNGKGIFVRSKSALTIGGNLEFKLGRAKIVGTVIHESRLYKNNIKMKGFGIKIVDQSAQGVLCTELEKLQFL